MSLGCDKPMDVFGGWDDYVSRLEANWNALVTAQDTVVVCGDISWALKLEESLPDLTFLNGLSGSKLILKGNHDLWWGTRSKVEALLSANGLTSIKLLFNNSYVADGLAIAGTRGWLDEDGVPEDEKVLRREAGRLRLSLDSLPDTGAAPTVFLHFPPIYRTQKTQPIIDVLNEYGVERCYYGHIHGEGIPYAVNGERDSIAYRLISADALNFRPYKIV